MLPLEGITVVSLEHAIAAPFCTRQLADQGARVIKVERPGVGDFARAYDGRVAGLASHFVWINRSKQSLTLDLKHADAPQQPADGKASDTDTTPSSPLLICLSFFAGVLGCLTAYGCYRLIYWYVYIVRRGRYVVDQEVPEKPPGTQTAVATAAVYRETNANTHI